MALDKKKYVVNIVKQTKSVFKGETVPKHISVNRILSNHGIEEVHIVGFDTNDCVLATAYEAFDLGYFTFVIEECVQSSSGDDMHNAGLLLLRNVDLTNHQKK
jgi:nicotinamidase-related amidase